MKDREKLATRACAIALGAMLALHALPASAMYKCQATGGTTFQQTPCENVKDAPSAYQPAGMPKETENVPVPAASPAIEAPAVQAQGAVPAGAAADPQEINRGIVGSFPVRGMTIAQLQSAMGTPERINSDDYQGGSTDQRIYTKPQMRYYVYTDGVKVRSVQSSQLVDTSPQASSHYCPSAFEIKNEEVSASSITLTTVQRQEKLDHIKAMRECRS